MKQEKHIPTILGLVLLLGAIFGGVVLTNQKSSPTTQASGSCDPVNPQITNVSYNSVNISFITSSECLSTISVDNRIFNDVRNKSKVHYFEVTSLKENNPYSFSIISGGQNFSSDSFNFQTAKKPNKSIPSSNLAWGRVFTPQNQPASNSIVYLTIPGSAPLSALVTSSGNWNIPLSTSFNESLSDWFTPPSNIEENIVVISSESNQTQVIGNTSRNNPVPDIILGQNNFTPPSVNQETESGSLINNQTNLSSSDNDLSISNPKDNESISSQRPDFFGTAPSGKKIKIEVHSSTILNGEVTVDDDGNWHWSPNQNLDPGEHTITVTTDDNKTITKKFVVLAAEQQPAFSASSSASTITSTPTPTTKLSPTPTIKISPTAIPTSKSSTASTIPKTGVSFPTFFLIFFSIGLITLALIYHQKSSF